MKRFIAAVVFAFLSALSPVSMCADTSAIKQYIIENYPEELPKGADKMSLRRLRRQLDSWTQVLSEEEITFRNEMFDGIAKGTLGIESDVAAYGLLVKHVIPGGPAYYAGLRSGDVIVSINGSERSPTAYFYINFRLTGETGTSVNIRYARQQDTLSTVLKYIDMHIDPMAYFVSGKTLSIKIYRFITGLTETFMRYTSWIDTSTIDTIIFDVRGNPGGLRNEAIDLLKQFVPYGDTLVAYSNRKNIEYDVNTKRGRWSRPRTMFVLQDENSASGSELLAGTLLVRCHATIIGTTSYGKGRMQRTFANDPALQDKSEAIAGIVLTTAFFLPGGTLHVDGIGVKPAIEYTAKERETGQLPVLYDIAKWRRRIPIPTQRDIDSANALGYGNVAPIIWEARLDPYLAISDVQLALHQPPGQKKKVK